MENVTTSCRDINKLQKIPRYLLQVALVACELNKLDVLVTETYRSQGRQDYLYCKGRTVAKCVLGGVARTTAKKYADPQTGCVTWTRSSKHKGCRAVDLVPLVKGDALWNAEDPRFKKMIRIMKRYGFTAGADWTTTKDYPHFQIDFSGPTINYLDTTKEFTLFLQRVMNDYVMTNTLDEVLLKVDGIWGKATTNRLNMIKKRFKYPRNGVVGIDTLKKLMA